MTPYIVGETTSNLVLHLVCFHRRSARLRLCFVPLDPLVDLLVPVRPQPDRQVLANPDNEKCDDLTNPETLQTEGLLEGQADAHRESEDVVRDEVEDGAQVLTT